MSDENQTKRPPVWHPIERAKYELAREAFRDVKARVLSTEEVTQFDIGVPENYKTKPFDFVIRSLGYGKDQRKLPEGSGAGFVQTPFSDIYTKTYGVTTNADLPTYRKIFRSQPDVQQAIQLQVTMSMGKGFVITHKDKEVQDYLNKFYDDVNLLQSSLVMCQDMLVYGTSFSEIQWTDREQKQEQIYTYQNAEVTTSEIFEFNLNGKVQTLCASGSTEPLIAPAISRSSSGSKVDEKPYIVGLKCLDPIYMKIRQDSWGNQLGYTQWMTSPPIYLENDCMVCIKNRPTSIGMEGVYGVSQLQAILKNYDLLNQFENDAYTWVHSRAVPPLIARGGSDPQHPYTNAQMQDLMKKLGGRTAASILGVKSDVELVELMGAARNLNLDWWLNYLLTRRYQALGVPPIMMGVSEGSNRATGEVVFQDFITRLQLIQKLMGDALETQVLMPLVEAKFGSGKEKPKIVWKPIVEEDRNMRSQRLIQALQGRAISINEFRQAIGYERIEDRPDLDEVNPAPEVPPSNLLGPPKPGEASQGAPKPAIGNKPGFPPSKPGQTPAVNPAKNPIPEGVQKKEGNDLLEQEIRVKKMRLLVGQEHFKNELLGIVEMAKLEFKQGDRTIKDIKTESIKKAKEVIKRNVSNSFLFGKLDSVFSHKLEVGESLPTEAFTITKEDLPEVIKMEKKFTNDFSAILDDMFKIEE